MSIVGLNPTYSERSNVQEFIQEVPGTIGRAGLIDISKGKSGG